MSTTTKKAGRPLTPNEKKTIIIAVICIAMAIILGVSLPLLLKQSDETTNPPTNKPDESNLYISNGHFVHVDAESTTFPKAANDWKLYKYKAPEGEAQNFEEIQLGDEAAVYAGVVDLDNWDAVTADLNGLSVTKPALVNETDTDSNVYMIATKQATNAGIASKYFSIGAQASAKISVSLNTAQLKAGSKAFVMIQQYNSSALSAKTDARYAHTFEIEQAEGWQTIELYVFNRQTSSQSVVCTIGIGNIYDEENAEGILFIDNVDFTTVTANDYRITFESDQSNSRYHIIGKDEIRADSDYVTLVNLDGSQATKYDSESYLTLPETNVEGQPYSPFISEETLKIFRVANDGSDRAPVALKLDNWNDAPIVVKSDTENAKDHLHISFWVRVVQNNVLAKCNITLQQMKLNGDGELVYDKDLSSGSFTSVVTSQSIAEDSNCGWTKYDIYLKPTSAQSTTVRVVFSLGNINGYAQAPYTPNGTLFVTSPFVESITASDYSNASTSSYSKKLSLVGATSSTSVSNGSFSSIISSNPNQPSNWTPVFAGSNIIYKDGKGNITPANLPVSVNDATGNVVRNAGTEAPLFDDSEANYLKLQNNVATSYGYLSNDITLSANTVYAFSVLAKTSGNLNPYFYVVKNGAESRAQAVIGKIESKADASKVVEDSKFALTSFKEQETNWTADGWTRYYIVIVNGDSSQTVRVALFNGSIDGSKTQQGVVCYDYVSMMTLGTYTVDTAEYKEGDEDAPATERDRIKFTASTGYTVFDKLEPSELTALANKEAFSNVTVNQPSDDEWKQIVDKAMEKTDDTDLPSDEPSGSNVNWALLTSVISSVALVGSLLIVVVIRQFKKRNSQF